MNNIKNKVKAIIFDMDGTIIQTEHIWQIIMKQLIIANGAEQITQKHDDVLKMMGSAGLRKSLTILKNEFALTKSVEELINECTDISRNQFLSNTINFVEGFETFHNKIKTFDIKNGIATNACLKDLNVLNEKINLEKYFGTNIYCVEHVNNKAKPDPTLFLHTAEKLNAKPEECIIFEDSLVGFQAAKNAGIKCIAIKNDFNKDIIHHADNFIETYHQAEEIIKKMI